MNSLRSAYWRRKINALLHDTPDKATDIADHENRAAQIKAIFQFEINEMFEKSADWNAAAADRLPFPSPNAMRQDLAEIKNLPHPLGGGSLPNIPFKTSTEALEITQKTHPFLLNNDDPRAAFICIWRFWRNWATAIDPRFTRLPADTRIPDHTIWNHLNVTTAFQGSHINNEQKNAHTSDDLRPRLLLFSVGPVRELIAAARSTKDLWSGSYLLSYLVSHALGKIARELGPDHVIFPNLLDQPLIDLQLKEEVFSKVGFGEETIWQSLAYDQENVSKLLTPSLPNRFMALLPAFHPDSGKSTADYAKELAESVGKELRQIAVSVRDFLADHPEPSISFDAELFLTQADRILEIQWQVLPIPETFDELYETANRLLPEDQKEDSAKDATDYQPRAAIDAIKEMVQKANCKPQYEPLKPETGWSLLNALIAFLHDGVKSTRQFDAWRTGRWESGTGFNKDALNGKEEVVFKIEGDQTKAQAVSGNLELSRSTFKAGELLGASTLIKRLWHHTYLPKKIGMSSKKLRNGHPMPNTHAIAKGRPFDGSDESEEAAEQDHGDKYFAILALDGDEMGKWVSGSKTPLNEKLLSPAAIKFYELHAPEFLKARRAVTPSWHLQFAEALGNFSFHAVQRVVEAFDGRLLYAGGDDVLAMLPAKDALRCARALRAAFRGEAADLNQLKGQLEGVGEKRKSDRRSRLFELKHDGFLQLYPKSQNESDIRAMEGLIADPVKFPAIVPGPCTDVSVGIAIAHFKTPLQDVVRAAQVAEKRAKRSVADGGLGRGAVALSIYKRSGEILEWGTRWSQQADTQEDDKTDKPKLDSIGYQLFHVLADALLTGHLNTRFPHKLEALLAPYSAQSTEDIDDLNSQFPEIFRREVAHCLSRNVGTKIHSSDRQGFLDRWPELDGPKFSEGLNHRICELFSAYWLELEGMTFSDRLNRMVHLLRAATWSVRGATAPSKSPEPTTI